MCYVLANLVCFVQIMTNVLITGGSGLIGRRLTTMLQQQGYRVGWLSRQAATTDGVRVFHWQPAAGQLDDAALLWADSLIHLAGETVAQRWSKSARQRILHSRLQSTHLLADRLAASGKRLQSVICASAIGFYGHRPQEVLTEENPPGQGFLAEVTTAWEATTNKLATATDHLAKVRIGVVLATAGGALPRMMTPVKWGLGASLGNGRQWMSWITIDDLCRLFVFILQKRLTGVYNGVAPTPVTNRDFTRMLARTLHRPLWLPAVPAPVLRLLLGEMSALLLDSARVLPKAALTAGFTFRNAGLESALQHLLAEA